MPINYDRADKEVGLAVVAEAAGIQRVEVLHGHTSAETAYVQPDYPYGRRLRCQRRVWVEQATKGSGKGQYRMVTQTTNPKVEGERWNKPHPGTYSHFLVLVKLPPEVGDDYLETMGFGFWGPRPAQDVIFHVSGIYDQLTDEERDMYAMFLRLSHKGDRTGWDRWEQEVIPAMVQFQAANGRWPNPENPTEDLGMYLGTDDYPAAVAAAVLADYMKKD